MFTDSAMSQLISPKCICSYADASQKNHKLEFIATVNVTTTFFFGNYINERKPYNR